VIAGVAASALHGTRWVNDTEPIEILVDDRRRQPGLLVRMDRVADDEITVVDDLPVTALARTAFDLGRYQKRFAAIARLDALMRAAPFSADEVSMLMRRYGPVPVMIYDNLKANRLQRHRPIAAATVTVIERQQRRVRQRFPDTPAAELKLLPTSIKNPDGAKGMRDETVGARHRKWVDSLPDVLVPTASSIDGKAAEPMPFDKGRMFPYAYRHT